MRLTKYMAVTVAISQLLWNALTFPAFGLTFNWLLAAVYTSIGFYIWAWSL